MVVSRSVIVNVFNGFVIVLSVSVHKKHTMFWGDNGIYVSPINAISIIVIIKFYDALNLVFFYLSRISVYRQKRIFNGNIRVSFESVCRKYLIVIQMAMLRMVEFT